MTKEDGDRNPPEVRRVRRVRRRRISAEYLRNICRTFLCFFFCVLPPSLVFVSFFLRFFLRRRRLPFLPFFFVLFFGLSAFALRATFARNFIIFFAKVNRRWGFSLFWGGRSMSDLWRPMNDDPIGIGADSLPFYWLASLTEFYRVLPGFTGFRADRGHISRFDRVSSRANRVLPSFTGF